MNFRRTLSAAVLMVLTLPPMGCSSAPKKGVVVENLVSDPLTESLVGVDARGIEKIVPWKESGNYVCRLPEEDARLQQATRCK